MSQSFYSDIALHRVSQITDFRVHNVTTTQRDALAAVLGAPNEGLHVWDTTLKQQFYWNGTEFINGVAGTSMPGAMVYKGTITDDANAPAAPDVGYVYVWDTTSATLAWAGQTFSPDASVQKGDQIIYRGANVWDIFQADLNPASQTDSGYSRFGTQPEVNAATATDLGVSPATLQGFVDARAFGKVYFNSAINTTALTPFTVTHNLNLQNKDSFVISIKNSAGAEITLDVVSATVNTLTITSSVSLSNLKVTVIGF